MSAEQVISLITGGVGSLGVVGIFLFLIISDKLHTDGEFQRLQNLLDKAENAHAETRRALAAAIERGDAAVRASEVIANAFASAGQGRGTSVP